jgi:hypothetical protein
MNYVSSEEIERNWSKWKIEKCDSAWEGLQQQVYKICIGISTKFRPKDEEEHADLAHEAFILTMDKIKDGRLTFDDRAPVFNLLTTTIFRHLYSLKNRDARRKTAIIKYAKRALSNVDIKDQLSSTQLNHIWGSLSTIDKTVIT